VYGHFSFGLVLAQKLGLELVSPSDRFLLGVPFEFLRRAVKAVPLGGLSTADLPAFVKPIVPKQFRAAIYSSLASLRRECRGLPKETELMVSEIVTFSAEARAFVLEGDVLSCAVYEGTAKRETAHEFAGSVASTLKLPHTCVLDVGLIDQQTWVLVEANATWGSGLNGCDPDQVLPAIAAATRPARRR
jgi:hypothetical protein